MSNMSSIQISESFSRDGGCKPFLTLEQVEERCPVAFTSEATHPTCSDKYVPLRTADVIQLVSTFGWQPVSAKQTGKGPKPARSLHMVVFEHPDKSIMHADNVVGVPRLILINSLDGFTKLQFFCGFFRFVCSNGLVISDASFGSLKVRHAKTTMEDVANSIKEVLAKMDPAMETISNMSNTVLEDTKLNEFYLEALALRINFKRPAENPSLDKWLKYNPEMLLPLHESDQGRADLWFHYNNAQERMVKGRFNYTTLADEKGRSLRQLSGLNRSLEFNRDLFRLATQFVINE